MNLTAAEKEFYQSALASVTLKKNLRTDGVPVEIRAVETKSDDYLEEDLLL